MLRQKTLFPLFCAFIISTGSLFGQDFPDKLTLKEIFHEPFIPGTRPNFTGFSPSGDSVYYSWSDSATSKTESFKVSINGGMSKKADKTLPRFAEVSPDGKRVLYQANGNLMLADAGFTNPRVIVSAKGMSSNPKWNTDGTRFAFSQNGDIWISGVDEAFIKQITEKEKNEPGYIVNGWAGDELLVQQTDRSELREYYFPEYVHKYVQTGASTRGIATAVLSLVSTETGKIRRITRHKGFLRADISACGRYIALDVTDPAMKKRTISAFETDSLHEKVLFEDTTEGWLTGSNMQFAPATNKLMFQSERDGWNHIYTVNPDGSGFTQHTFGSFDIPWARWVNEHEIAMASSQNDPGEIQLYLLDVLNNNLKKLTSKEAYRKDFALSPDKKHIVYQRTYFNEPFDLYTIRVDRPLVEMRLSYSVPDAFYEFNWQKEDYVRFTGRDGSTKLSMSVLKPERLLTEGNPVVVFVHGAGSLQNVYKGWSDNYWREYLFHQLLTLNGYYVIEVDYRHSTGYGRKFREDVTNWMGKYETEDIIDGLAFLADNYDRADTSRVGIYGGSYGGFMALYAIQTEPEFFDAAAALRAVTKWENYFYTNPHYTLPRLGDPEQFPEHYKRSNPITYADSLRKPVLLLHGLIDNNVGFQDIAQYIQVLIDSGNEDFEFMMYPDERHGFTKGSSWYDEYRRIYEFFNKHLKNKK